MTAILLRVKATYSHPPIDPPMLCFEASVAKLLRNFQISRPKALDFNSEALDFKISKFIRGPDMSGSAGIPIECYAQTRGPYLRSQKEG